MTDSVRFEAAMARIDAANNEDPTTSTHAGTEYPREYLYSLRMTEWLEKLAPDASEALRLAARSQHIRRWRIPRGDYPMDRCGYYEWRTTLQKFHAAEAGRILSETGYDAEVISRVQSLLRKERLKEDPETQLLEDVICLVFLEDHFAGFAKQHDEAKLLSILRRTWKKMSPRGRKEALELELAPADRAVIEKAVAPLQRGGA